jgi:drug/metabolite transporter (DMT)-like permease
MPALVLGCGVTGGAVGAGTEVGAAVGAVMTKYALGQVPPLTLLVVQLVVSVVVLWLAVAVQGIPVRGSRDSVRLGLIGVLNPGLAYTFSLFGLAQTTASMSALLWAAEPILIIGFAWLLLCERLTRPLLACTALTIVGVGVVAGLDVWGGGNSSLLGNLLIVSGVCCDASRNYIEMVRYICYIASSWRIQ